MRKWQFNNRYGLTAAVKSGIKTMTRRSAKKVVEQYRIAQELTGVLGNPSGRQESLKEYALRVCPIKVGEVVAVAQSYRDAGLSVHTIVGTIPETGRMIRAEQSEGWRNKLFVRADLMPTRVRVTAIGFERLQDISDEDCLKEGICQCSDCWECSRPCFSYKQEDECCSCEDYYDSPRKAFAVLIDKVSGKGTWESNEYHYVFTFELVN